MTNFTLVMPEVEVPYLSDLLSNRKIPRYLRDYSTT